jgi:hypothetical protein
MIARLSGVEQKTMSRADGKCEFLQMYNREVDGY